MAAGLLALTGCNSRPETFPVKGKVTFKSRSVPMGAVVFHPRDDKLPMAKGEIRSDGSYELTTFQERDGAAAGEYQVTVHSFTLPQGTEGEEGYRSPVPLAPLKYTRLTQTPLTATVEKKPNVIDFELKP
jgi:hypothetical protein